MNRFYLLKQSYDIVREELDKDHDSYNIKVPGEYEITLQANIANWESAKLKESKIKLAIAERIGIVKDVKWSGIYDEASIDNSISENNVSKRRFSEAIVAENRHHLKKYHGLKKK